MKVVRYLATPVALFLELQESLDGFQREVQLSSLDGAEPVGRDVVEGMVVERDAFVALRLALHDQAAAARDAGLTHADLEVEYPDDAIDRVLMITTAARQADRAAAEGRLLTPPVRDEVRRVQTWMYQQVEVQLAGGPPTPFDPDATPGDQGFTLRLADVPPTLMLDLLGTLDALHREVQVTAMDGPGPSPVGREAHDALVEDRMRVEEPRNAILDQAVAGRDAGAELIDIAADYAAADIAPFLSARAGVATADAAAQRGELLASPMTPEQRRLWLWVGVEFEVQAAGGAPSPFAPAG